MVTYSSISFLNIVKLGFLFVNLHFWMLNLATNNNISAAERKF